MAEGSGGSHPMQTLENGVTPSSTRSQSLCSEIVRIEQQSTDHCRSRFSALINSVRNALVIAGNNRKKGGAQQRPDSFLEKFTSHPAQSTEDDPELSYIKSELKRRSGSTTLLFKIIGCSVAMARSIIRSASLSKTTTLKLPVQLPVLADITILNTWNCTEAPTILKILGPMDAKESHQEAYRSYQQASVVATQ